ncbi:pilin (plasmid) [Clostridium perfringens]|uniref:pilin n=1 Tax=Clostridium perfringens TaxID=1502 RepID=UPI000B383280|nr:pilin [Clostridium perfringens]EGT0690191.1 hypothetical protein [Clostridium perfringens]EGT0693825.1 hypothetical protein [Clostridium perfringens]EGT0696712.1 hypothetical protein [Clostridium perfringens]MDU3376292.1 pilin [Clostridium perfringens]MDU3536254.1 pilin [Clostridium perfringens]
MLINLMDKVNLAIMKVFFLAEDSIGDISNQLGIQASSNSDIGKSVLPAIKSLMITIAIICAVAVFCIVAIYLIVSRRQEQRTEAMQRMLWAGVGLFICATATGLVGYIVGLIQ